MDEKKKEVAQDVPVQEQQNKICPRCGKEITNAINFCPHCKQKLNEICRCWVKKKPYNCGYTECPGYNLLIIENLKP